ncbi:MAG: thiamine biosynthesis protein ThiS [Gammaproteobacteria bacterium]|nr:thiamine biosynthesis protein ThiS [Gammaproteobacteria bacterium]MAY01421.1 thiamine biosynthesis protein ThiS [Gammaproteobacteria bacterium]|tara:strand:- start:117 stop:386 length:270 start_codon:yes stop_codon:yes gene_type:complete
MVLVEFTPNLEKHLACPTQEVEGSSVREVLQACCEQNPELRSYILDDQNRIRKHIAVFVDGVIITDKIQQSDKVKDKSVVYVAQALSGG